MRLNKDVYDKLRPYQKEAFNKILKETKDVGILEYDDMGLGKTLTMIASIEEMNAYPLLVIVPKFGLYVWETEFKNWVGRDCVVYSGKPNEREQQWKKFITEGCKVLITNYALLSEVAIRSGINVDTRTSIKEPGTFKWEAIIWDEAHMGGLFNHKAEAFKVSAKLSKTVPVRAILTGTPLRKGCVDLYGPLHLAHPQRFDSYWKYVNKYCVIIETPFGKEIQRNPADIPGFRNMLGRYMIRRTKEELLDELPGKLRQPLYVKMDEKQQKLYDELTAELLAIIPDSGELLITPNQMTLMVRQKQILACPKVLGINSYGAAIETILEHSHTRLDEGHPIAVFTPYRQAVPYVEEAFRKEYKGIEVYKITGGLTAEEFAAQWQGFQNSKNPNRMLLCVIKSSASFQGTAADTAYFLGYEEDFNLNEQAEDRLNRMGQKNFVNVYYLMYKGTVDDVVASRLNQKKDSSLWIVGTEKQYLEMLKKAQNNKGIK